MRERLSMDRDWAFHLGDIENPVNRTHDVVYGVTKAGGLRGPGGMEWNDYEWERVQLPHDWSYQLPFDRENGVPNFGYKPRGVGWYRKKFRLEESDNGKQLLLEFDGVATHCTIYFNGSVIERNFSGYTSFVVDITDRAVYGDRPNVLAVRVDSTVAEGWWYEGAGIYRHVWLTKKSSRHIGYRGVWVRPEKEDDLQWVTRVETTICNESEQNADYKLSTQIWNPAGTLVEMDEQHGSLQAGESRTLIQAITVCDPFLWDIKNPNLYEIHSVLFTNGRLVDREVTSFGYRTIRICPDQGFFLNEQPLKLKGTCNHQDHAGVGVAVPDGIQEFRIRRLKEMGSNAYRPAHHNPSPELLDICDRLGMLVMDENRNFDSSREGLLQLENMVTRDRNHPCVVLYSLFNEEPHQSTPVGRKMMKRMMRTVKRLDPTRPVLGALNGGVMEDEGTADIMDITGFNYMHGVYDKFKLKHPGQPIIGSETVSAFSTRGNYVYNSEKQVFDSYDRQRAPWGATVREGWKAVATRDYVMGTFVWTGFDYRGEPTPYEWPSINTHFGIMDTCGFPKDAYFLYQSYWLEEPILHILPHWNWKGKEGEPITIMTHTNCDEVELFINGNSIERKVIDPYQQAEWSVPYEPGEVRMEGYRNGKLVKVSEVQTTGPAVSLHFTPQKNYIYGDGWDAIAVNIHAVDSEGRFVATDNRKIRFQLIGSGRVIGTGNGDPNSHEPDHALERSLFNGSCQVILQSLPGNEDIVLTAEGEGMKPVELELKVIAKSEPPFVPSIKERSINEWHVTQQPYSQRPDPNMPMDPTDMNTWEKVDIGYGALNMLKGVDGFVVFRNRIHLSDAEKNNCPSLMFQAICGYIEVYADGELLKTENSVSPINMEVTLNNILDNDSITISVLIELKSYLDNPGICGSVWLFT